MSIRVGLRHFSRAAALRAKVVEELLNVDGKTDEDVKVDTFRWSYIGSSPYLDSEDESNYIKMSPTCNASMTRYYTMEDLQVLTSFSKVTLFLKVKNANTILKVQVYRTSSSYVTKKFNIAYNAWHEMSVDLTTFLTTVAYINYTKLAFYVDLAGVCGPFCAHAYLKVEA